MTDSVAGASRGAVTRWFTPENPLAEVGRAGVTNRGAKGRAFVPLAAGETLTLVDARGSGTIRRIWLTLEERTPEVLRGIRVVARWDDAAEPAISVPLGDFFGHPLGRMVAFESAMLSSPEGRSLCSFVPMPFRTAAKLELVNESGVDVSAIYYDVAVTLGDDHPVDTLWLHAAHHVDRPALGESLTVLPAVQGSGRFLGLSTSLIEQPMYRGLWCGEGEVRMRVDGHDTLSGTGLEDYIGTAYGMGAFANRTQGCPVADEATGQWSLYRWHLDDPVWFSESIEVTLQQIGGGKGREVWAAMDAGGEARTGLDRLRGAGLHPALRGSAGCARSRLRRRLDQLLPPG